MRWLRFSLVPALAALAATFALLPRTGAAVEIEMVEGGPGIVRFTPSDVHIDVGDRVAFTNTTERSHTASCVGCDRALAWSTGVVQPGQTVFVTFPQEGAFTYGDPSSPPDSRALLQVGDVQPAQSPSPSPSPSPA